ncbi:hypothetical protein JIX56_15910 [Streptomyces sp. CA-210063]|uniref:hypothetical protein n=1 Tax=Streptomyces sp. CA-210063 TaxID=2801029 RepID=UPI00214C91F8|nr:hypothetical protein [Streptomyces sp. CA-210063]UUU31267.1 hypothetical protein JIX56_15910 [Streptomyces sp. CA-210063]
MCVSLAPAEFSGTTLYCGRLHHADHGLIHVLGYQNTATNLADGPNAMLLHLPAQRMSRRHFLSVGRSSDLLKRMVDAVRPVSAGVVQDSMDWMGGDPPPAVEVFEHDVYTVVLARDPRAVPAALTEVPERQRPALDPELFTFYAERYPGHAIAVCCFDNAQAAQAKPLLMWYPPLDPELLTLPALDCHTGGVPDLDSPVPVDHWVILGSDEAPADWGAPVAYDPAMRHGLRDYLPGTVIGWHFDGTLPNGDFAISHDDLLSGDPERVTRVRPQL